MSMLFSTTDVTPDADDPLTPGRANFRLSSLGISPYRISDLSGAHLLPSCPGLTAPGDRSPWF